MREKIRAKSWYQLFEVIQFLKLLSRIVRGQFSLGQTLQVIALGQKDTSPVFINRHVHGCDVALVVTKVSDISDV